jgi:hypothetical protein
MYRVPVVIDRVVQNWFGDLKAFTDVQRKVASATYW